MKKKNFLRFFGDCPTFQVPGRTYEVEETYSKNVVEDYVDAAIKTVTRFLLFMNIGGT